MKTLTKTLRATTSYKTQWDFHHNEIIISSDIRREIEYGYGNPLNTIADSVENFVKYNNDYRFIPVDSNDTLESVKKKLYENILDGLSRLEIYDTKGNSFGTGIDYYKPDRSFVIEMAEFNYDCR